MGSDKISYEEFLDREMYGPDRFEILKDMKSHYREVRIYAENLPLFVSQRQVERLKQYIEDLKHWIIDFKKEIENNKYNKN